MRGEIRVGKKNKMGGWEGGGVIKGMGLNQGLLGSRANPGFEGILSFEKYQGFPKLKQ